jgi:hypothetical protein
MILTLNWKAGARRVKIDPATKDMRDDAVIHSIPYRIHMPSDASCVGRDSISLVNHEIKINHGHGVGKYSIIKLNQKGPVSGIISHIVTVFGFHSN